MLKQSHIAIGLATASTIAMLTHQVTCQEFLLGSVSAYLAAYRPDDDLIDNRSHTIKDLTFNTLKASALPMTVLISLKLYNCVCFDYEEVVNLGGQIFLMFILWVCLEGLTILSPHRGWSHSIPMCLIYTYIWYFMTQETGYYASLWFLYSYISHLIIDLLNRSEVKLFVNSGFCLGICSSDGIVNEALKYIGAVVYFIVASLVDVAMFSLILGLLLSKKIFREDFI